MDENEMVNFIKAIADADRLQIVGLLTHKSARLSEIIDAMGFHPTDTQHHLDLLLQSGVVRLSDGLYELDADALEKLKRQQFKGESPAYAPELSLEKNQKRVLAAYLNPDGTIKTIPLQPARLRIILDYLINAFTVGIN
jgi:DNA-binding transcriptional ArsR family regulator